METSTGIHLDSSEIMHEPITITFTLKKAIVVGGAFLTFLTSTAGPFFYIQYQKKIDNIKQQIEMDYKLRIQDAELKANDASAKLTEAIKYKDSVNSIKSEYNSIIRQLRDNLEFFKIHTCYNTAYILYTENKNNDTRKRYLNSVSEYAKFIVNKKTYQVEPSNSSFYLSDSVIYVEGKSYAIPHDVLVQLNNLKN